MAVGRVPLFQSVSQSVRGRLWVACEWGPLFCVLAGCVCAETGAAVMVHRGHFHFKASTSKIAIRVSLGWEGDARFYVGAQFQRNVSKLSWFVCERLSFWNLRGGGRVARVGCL